MTKSSSIYKGELLEFLFLLKERTPDFVKDMESQQVMGKYRFSYSGDLIPTSRHWGLGQSTFAARILYIFDMLTPQKASHISNYIHSFEDRKGAIYDPEIARKSLLRRIAIGVYKRDTSYLFNRINKRAETRQGIAALINLSSFPENFYSDLKMDSVNIKNYVNSLDWSVPWRAGSHFNHQMFFLRFDSSVDEVQKNIILELFLDGLRQYEQVEGFYEEGALVRPQIMVGGLMKVLMALSLFDKAGEFVKESFVDLCLDKMISCDACENFNTIYILYQCSKVMDYRKDEIELFLLETAIKWKGFSFYKNKSGYSYYDATISKGLNEPDLHGTAMFVWGFLIIAKALGLDDELGLREPVL